MDKKSEAEKSAQKPMAPYERPKLRPHGSIEKWTRKGGSGGDGTKKT